MADLSDKHEAHCPLQIASQRPIPSLGRRRLLKGAALAMPAVLTLRSGAALAASSMACVGRGVNMDGTLINQNAVARAADNGRSPLIVMLDNNGNFMEVTTDPNALNRLNAFEVSVSCWETSVMGAMTDRFGG